MNRVVAIIIGCFLLMDNAAVSSSDQRQEGLSPKDQASIEGWAKTKNSVYIEALLPEYRLNKSFVSATNVPRACIDHATKWAKKVLQDKWLPLDLDKKWLGLKNAILMEKKDKNGISINTVDGDYLVADYQIDKYVFHLQDTGVTLSIRIDFADKISDRTNIADQVSDLIDRFLFVPSRNLDQLRRDIIIDSNIMFGLIKNETKGKSNRKYFNDGTFWNEDEWYDRINVCMGENFFFALVYEKDVGKMNPQAKPGLPKRFDLPHRLNAMKPVGITNSTNNISQSSP